MAKSYFHSLLVSVVIIASLNSMIVSTSLPHAGSRHCPLGFFWPRSNVRVDFVRFSDLDSHCLSPQLQEDASIFTVPGCPTDFTWKGL